MNLPLQKDLSLLQTKWKSILDPVVGNPINNVSILEDVSLINGVNSINHKLGQKQQGWFLVDKQGVADVYRSAPFNSLTLQLTSNANVLVSIGVF